MLKPKCVGGKSFALNSQGYLLPCCWADPLRKLKPDYDGNMDGMDELFKKELNIENVDGVDDIILSTEWINFFNRLISGTSVPEICVKYCGNDMDTRKEIVYE